MFFLGIFAEFFVRTRLIDWSDPSGTLMSIKSSDVLFDAAIFSFYVIILLDVVLGVCLYVLFSRADKTLALLMCSLRLVYVGIKAFSLVALLMARDISSEADAHFAGGIDTAAAEMMQFLKLHHYGFAVGLIFFGFHLICLAFLLSKNHHFPSLYSWFTIAAGIGYCTNSLMTLFAAEFKLASIIIIGIFIIPMTFSELMVGVKIWLTHKASRPNS